jgi:crotonobetaine/carnitine-CoA ligase
MDVEFLTGDSGLLVPGTGVVKQQFHHIPEAERNIPAVLRDAQDRYRPDDIFLDFNGDVSLTYAEVTGLASPWLGLLDELGTSAGARIAVMLPNSPEYVGLLLALWSSGRVCVPLNTALTGWSLEYSLRDSGASVLIVDEAYLDRINPGWDLPRLRCEIVLAPAAADGADPGWDGRRRGRNWRTIDLREGLPQLAGPADSARWDPGTRDSSSVATILYTSGTTGPPKGAVIGHEHLYFYAWQFAYMHSYAENDTLLTVLPLFHVNAQCSTLLAALLSGSRVALYSRFSASRFWHHIHDSGATQFSAIGSMAGILLNRDPSEYVPGHRLRMAQIAPAPNRLREFEERFEVPVVFQRYGMTEGMFVLSSHDRHGIPGSIGYNHPYHDIRIVNSADEPCGPGVAGEIVVRPKRRATMFDEYLDKPAETAAAWRGGWFHTGDLGEIDAHGSLFFRGRSKDVIRRRGENISAFLIEREALGLPGVVDAAAVGVESEIGEEEVKLCLQLDQNADLDYEQVITFLSQRLPEFMVPRYVNFRSTMPRNAAHRILKTALREEGVSPECWDRTAA